ncbi:MAG: hypothetical protein ABIH99_05615, partial [Candidatus Micrarchaeota archaeon]
MPETKYIVEDKNGKHEATKREFEEAIKLLGKFHERKRLVDDPDWKILTLYENGHRKTSHFEDIEYLKFSSGDIDSGIKKGEKQKFPRHLCQRCGGRIRISPSFERYCETCGEVSGSISSR